MSLSTAITEFLSQSVAVEKVERATLHFLETLFCGLLVRFNRVDGAVMFFVDGELVAIATVWGGRVRKVHCVRWLTGAKARQIQIDTMPRGQWDANTLGKRLGRALVKAGITSVAVIEA